MSGPDESAAGTATRRAAADGDPLAALQDDLQEHLEERRSDLLERMHAELWEPLRRSADRLGSLRDDALTSEDALRDAGRAVRMLCDEFEERDPAAVLREALGRHLDEVSEFAHRVPRMMAAGRAPGGGMRPARGAVKAVLAADYPEALRRALDPDVLVVEPGAAVPPSPADLLRPEDHSGRLTEAIDRSERHLRLALEEAAEAAVEETGALLRDGRTLDRLRLRWRRSRAAARRRALRTSLSDLLDGAGEQLRDLLDMRRFTADLARRERALTDAAAEAAERLEEAAGRGEEMRELAGRLERGGRSVGSGLAGRDEARGGPEPARLERLESRVRTALDRVRAGLPETDRPGTELTRSLGRFVQLAEALSGVGGAGEGTRTPAARRPGELRDRVSRAVPHVRETVREAGEIVGHGLRAARSESGVREPDPETVSGLVRESCERAARRLRDAAEFLEETLRGAAAEVREVPDEILAELRARQKSGAEPEAGWRRLLRKTARAAVRSFRRVRRGWSREGPDRSGGPGARGRAVDRRREQPGRGAPGDAEVPRSEGFEALPAIYRWLFRPEPLDDPHLLVGRDGDVERLRSLRRRWERGEPAATAVVGPPGSGKTSLLNCGARDLEAGVPVHRGRVDRRMTDAEEVVRWFARFFGVEGAPDTPEGLAEALEGRRELVLLENGERLFRREVGGYRAIHALGRLLDATGGGIAWVITFDREPWRVLRSVTGIEGRFGDALLLGPLDRRELEEALLARHRLTGYDLRFVGTGDLESRRAAWFDRLYELSAGWPGRALQIWRESLVATGPNEIRALPPRRPCPGRVGELDRESLFLLAALVQHGDLPDEDLPLVLHKTEEETSELLGPLRREGLVRAVPGLPPEAPLQVDRSVYAGVEERLRAARLLVPVGADAR